MVSDFVPSLLWLTVLEAVPSECVPVVDIAEDE